MRSLLIICYGNHALVVIGICGEDTAGHTMCDIIIPNHCKNSSPGPMSQLWTPHNYSSPIQITGRDMCVQCAYITEAYEQGQD